MKNIPIGEVLKEYGYITDEQIKRALEYQKTEEGRAPGGAQSPGKRMVPTRKSIF